MPEQLQAEVALDYSDAQARVEDLRGTLETALTTAAETFSTAMADSFSTIQGVAADTFAQIGASSGGAGLAEMGGQAQQLTFDFAQLGDAAVPALDEIASSSEAASGSIADLGTETASAGEGFDSLGAATAGLTGGLAIASGKGREAVSSFTEMGIVGAASAGGVLALAGGMAEFFEAGVKAESAAQRVKLAFGKQAEAVHEVNIGGLTGDLRKLSQEVGTSNAQLDEGIARLGQYGHSANFSDGETIKFTQQVTALALRATALNPSLGSVDQVVQRLQRGLATGGRFAQQFFLSLDRKDITDKAIEMFGGTADSLTQTQKAAAGAELAVDKLGGKLGSDFTKGAKSADNQLRSLKATLINAFEEAGAGKLVEDLTELLRSMIPVATTAIDILAPAFRAVASVLLTLRPILPAVATAFLAYKALGFLEPLLAGVTGGFIKTTAAVHIAALSTDAAAAEMIGDAEGVALAETLMAQAAIDAAAEIEAANAAIEGSAGPIGIAIAVVGIAATALGLFGSSADDAKTDLDKLGKQTDETFTKMAEDTAAMYAVFSKQGGLAGQIASDAVQHALKDLRDLADQNTDAAQRYGQALLDAGVISSGQFQGALNHGIKVQKDAAEATKQNLDATTKQTLAQQQAAFATDVTSEAVTRGTNIHKSAVSIAEALTVTTKLGTDAIRQQATAYATATQDVTDYKTALDVLNSGSLDVVASTQAQEAAFQGLTQAIKDNGTSLDIQDVKGNANISSLISLTRAVQGHAEAVLQQTDDQGKANAVMSDGANRIATLLINTKQAPDVIASMLNQLGLVPYITDAATRSLLGLGDVAGTTLPTDAQTGTDKFTGALGTLPSKTDGILKGTSLQVGGWDFTTLMLDTGGNAGYNLVVGFSNSVDQYGYYVTNSVNALVAKVRGALKISSPSLVFREIGDYSAQGYIDGWTARASDIEDVANLFIPAGVGLPTPPSSGISYGGSSAAAAAARAGQGLHINVDKIEVAVHGVADEQTAFVAGKAAGEGARAGLTGQDRRKIAIGAVTG